MRATEQEVKDILPSDTSITLSKITPYLVSANSFVTNSLQGELDDAVLKEIERWLTAHMVTVINERLSKEEGAGGAYIKYAGAWGEELASTQYGQMVLMLDTSNTLRNLSDGKKRASIYAVPGE